ncbi:hypothetical protein TCAL_12813, partial [Tigriopus californicus]|eukprot:TCALIF_12813-PA protein Name:"Similar to Cirl Latrophilin Cirl (Drosophila ananassae)" AED:0.12 eAED:0.12 QI:0/0.5/0/0.66/0.5/0/3/0/716
MAESFKDEITSPMERYRSYPSISGGRSSTSSSLLHRRTKYGCEGSSMVIKCDEGTQINVVRANFGRFSGSICNEFGANAEHASDWSVNCLEPRSLRVVNERCHRQAECEITVTSALFGDPCPGTYKYLEVHYTCQAVRPQTDDSAPKSLPPWLLDLAATPIPTKTAEFVRTEITSTTTTTVSTTSTTVPIHQSNLPEYDDLLDVTMNEVIEEDTFSQVDETENLVQSYCPPMKTRNLFWNWTLSGFEAIQVCPPGSTGFAKWYCNPQGQWATDRPSMGDCQSLWLNLLQSEVHASMERAVKQIATKTAELQLYGGDLPIITSTFQTLSDRLRHEHHILSSKQEKEEKLANILESVVQVVSNLLHNNQLEAWEELSETKRAIHFNGLLHGLNELARLYAESINVEMRATNVKDNILSEIRVLRSRGIGAQAFPDFVPNYFDGDVRVLMPEANLQEISQNGAVRTIFNIIANAERILPSFGSYAPNSKLITFSSIQSISKELPKEFIFSMRHHLKQKHIQDAICATWEANQRSWSTQDCLVIQTNTTHTTCSCSKLGSFAILTTEESVQVSQMSQEEQKGVILGSVVAGALVFFAFAILLLKLVLNGRCQRSSKVSETSYPPLTSSPTLSGVSAPDLTQRRPGTYLQQAIVDNSPGFYHQQKPTTSSTTTNTHLRQLAQPQQPSIHTIYRTDKRQTLMMPFQRPESHIYSEIIYNQLQ